MAEFDSRTQMEVLGRTECFALLQGGSVGRVAFVAEGRLTVIPVNYAFDADRVVFRTAEGAKLLAASGAQEVAFEVDGLEADARTGWSVVVNGVMTVVTEADEVGRLEAVGLRPWARAPKGEWVAINLSAVSGRRILTMAEQNRIKPDAMITLPVPKDGGA